MYLKQVDTQLSLKDITTTNQIEPGSNSNEGLTLHSLELQNWNLTIESAQLAGVEECTDCKTPLPANECPGYDIKQSDGQAPAEEIWGLWRTPSLPLHPGPLWPGVVAPDRALSMGQMAHMSANK